MGVAIKLISDFSSPNGWGGERGCQSKNWWQCHTEMQESSFSAIWKFLDPDEPRTDIIRWETSGFPYTLNLTLSTQSLVTIVITACGLNRFLRLCQELRESKCLSVLHKFVKVKSTLEQIYSLKYLFFFHKRVYLKEVGWRWRSGWQTSSHRPSWTSSGSQGRIWGQYCHYIS